MTQADKPKPVEGGARPAQLLAKEEKRLTTSSKDANFRSGPPSVRFNVPNGPRCAPPWWRASRRGLPSPEFNSSASRTRAPHPIGAAQAHGLEGGTSRGTDVSAGRARGPPGGMARGAAPVFELDAPRLAC